MKRVVTAATCLPTLTWGAAVPQAAPAAPAGEAPERTTCWFKSAERLKKR